MKKLRQPKESDQEVTEKIVLLLKKFMLNNEQIEPTLFYSAITRLLVRGFINSGSSYQEFCDEIDDVKEFYKSRWDKDMELEKEE